MKTYIYQDEKSHKFWAVEQQGNELHISWGKVSTNGQSQVKSFADAAAAEKAARALLPGSQLLPMYRGPKCTFVQIKTKSTKAGEKYAYSWVNLDLIN